MYVLVAIVEWRATPSPQFASQLRASESSLRAEHHPNNWLCRLRQIRHIRERCSAEHSDPSSSYFTSYS